MASRTSARPHADVARPLLAAFAVCVRRHVLHGDRFAVADVAPVENRGVCRDIVLRP